MQSHQFAISPHHVRRSAQCRAESFRFHFVQPLIQTANRTELIQQFRGSFWTDTGQLKYAIRKAGVAPSTARYRLLMDNKPERPDVDGWSPASYRSTAGMVRQSLGSTIEHSGLGASAAYWRKT